MGSRKSSGSDVSGAGLMYRKDILYNGSITNLPEYKCVSFADGPVFFLNTSFPFNWFDFLFIFPFVNPKFRPKKSTDSLIYNYFFGFNDIKADMHILKK